MRYTGMDHSTHTDVQSMREVIFAFSPVLRKILAMQGSLPLLTYFRESVTSLPSVPLARQEELFTVLHDTISRLISPSIASSAMTQLQHHYYVSTADHHGPLCHPFFLHGHLAQALANKECGLDHLIVLACSGISLNNSSFPRGVFFHDHSLTEIRLPFHSLRHRHHPVYAFPASRLRTAQRMAGRCPLAQEERERLRTILEGVCGAPDLFACQYYGEQITKMNERLWRRLPGQEHMAFLSLEQEDIVATLLQRYHLSQATMIHHLLFDERSWQAFEQHFDGIRGAFSSTHERGTEWFWALHEGQRKALRRRGNILVSRDGAYSLPLIPSSIAKALHERRIMPSMALSFILLSFYYGLRCGGGFSQVSYLTDMKAAYLTMIESLGVAEERQYVQSVDTTYFCGEIAFVFLENAGQLLPASSIDIILYGEEGAPNAIRAFSERCTLSEAFDRMIPTLYKIIAPYTYA